MEELAQLVILQLQNGGRARLTVTGCSMQPMLYHRRDAVELVPVCQRQSAGDVALYRRKNGQYVLHRIVAVRKDGYLCCGDNQAEPEIISHDMLLAVVDAFVRKGQRYTTKVLLYRLYTAVWVRLFFLRSPYIAVRRFLGRQRGRIRRLLARK